MGRSSSVPLSFSDRVVSFFSPQAGARRYAGRVALENLKRKYDGAAQGRLTDGWRASSSAADTEIALAGPVLRDRMRDLVRNNSLAANAVQVLVSSMVGHGIRPRARTGNPDLDKQINDAFEVWSKSCDAHGIADFYGLQSLAVREMLEGGDLFGVKRPKRATKSREVPLEIELMEADHLDDSKWQDLDGARISQGIEYNRSGKRAAYHLFPDHPGNASAVFSRSMVSRRVPASYVVHLYERQRIQSRGVPWGAPALRALHDLGDWQVAELMRKKLEACNVGVVFGEDETGSTSAAPVVEDAEGNMVEQFEPGMFLYARNGKDVKFNTPGHSSGVREWNTTQMHLIAAGFRIPYALLTGDLREANFSSSRVGLNEFRRMVTAMQWLVIIPQFCQPIWDWFCEAAWTAGVIPQPSVPVEWSPPRFESVNPWQDAQTDKLEVRAGFVSLRENIAKRGYDADAVWAEIERDNQRLDDAGLQFDSDARLMSAQGQHQDEGSDEPSNSPPSGAVEEEGGE